MTRLLGLLGAAVAEHPLRFIVAWVPIVLLAVFTARDLPRVTRGGAGVLDDSRAQRVNEALYREFADPWVDPLALVVASERYTHSDPPVQAVLGCSHRALEALPAVREIVGLEPAPSAPPGAAALLIALRSSEVGEQERAVPRLRAALLGCKEQFLRLDPQARFALTGRVAYTVDLNEWNKRSGNRAEARAVPLTLLILVLVFGSLAAAGLPLLMGLASTSVALALTCALARFMPVSNLSANVVTMLGLALGIDYSLLMVSHFRELSQEHSLRSALALTLSGAGRIIVWSGLTVSTALLGLLWTPLLETRGVGIGGAIVAVVSVLAATTLLPACLALIAPWLERPRILPRGTRARSAGFWARCAAGPVRSPLRTAALAATVIVVLALPALAMRSGFTNQPQFFPAGMEARVGQESLSALGHGNAALSIYLLVRTLDGAPVLSPAHLPALVEFAASVARDPRVAQVRSPVNLAPGATLASYQALYADLDAALSHYPQIASRWLSRDRRAALFLVTPAAGLPLADIQALAAGLHGLTPRGPFRVDAGGAPSYYNDFDQSLARSLPHAIGFILFATAAYLFAAFRSWLIPVKAILMNLLAVGAGLGVVVAVFQLGWGSALVGLDAPLAAIPPTVPLMIFCLSFGVSMDYELFLLFRIAAAYRGHGDTARATVHGVSSAAPVIAGAALIMAVVFAAFVGGDVQFMKMLGLGLTTTVVVDAILIRTLLLPAAMTLAGRWNWYPGSTGPPPPPRLTAARARRPLARGAGSCAGSEELERIDIERPAHSTRALQTLHAGEPAIEEVMQA